MLDIVEEEMKDNIAYCQELINKVFRLPYAQLPDFFAHHCNYVADPIKWLNKFERLVAENEELFVSSTNRGRMIKCYTIIEKKRNCSNYSYFKVTYLVNNNKKSSFFY